MSLIDVILIAAGVLSGLLAGLFFDFSVAIVPALRSLAAKPHLLTMQAINIKIKNPVFLVSFLGPTFLLPWAAYLQRGSATFWPLVLAASVFLQGVNAVTIAGNVPLNERLERVSVEELSNSEAEQIRQDYHGHEARWMQLHQFRTLAAVAAMLLILFTCLINLET